MRRIAASLTLMISFALASWGQGGSAPQTARQALMEMLFSKTPGTFAKHLPTITRAALEKSGAMASMQQYSLLINQMQAQGQSFETFETGLVMVATDNPKTGQKVEIRVDNDALRGDDDEIQVSFKVYKSGQEQRTPYMPQLTFSMKHEAQSWTLNEISLTVHVPLADPDLLKSFTEKMTAPPSAHVTYTAHSETPAQTAGTDSTVIAAMRTILAAEVTYATTYSTVGYTCTLSNLDGFGGGEPNAHQAMLINSGLASGKKYGYIFTLSECGGMPASGFRLTAAPNANTFGRKTFCADQTGVVRSSEDTNPAACMAGTPVQ